MALMRFGIRGYVFISNGAELVASPVVVGLRLCYAGLGPHGVFLCQICASDNGMVNGDYAYWWCVQPWTYTSTAA